MIGAPKGRHRGVSALRGSDRFRGYAIEPRACALG